MTKPFSPAAERNKQPILEKLQSVLGERKNVLEIGSGTAQHALYFAEQLPQLLWQTSNYPDIVAQTEAGLGDSQRDNVLAPHALDVESFDFAADAYDVVYSANTAHIMPWRCVPFMFAGAAKTLRQDGLFCLYGPFNYQGKFTSESNRAFDMRLKESNPLQGIRAFEEVKKLAESQGLSLLHDFAMPANNRFLIFIKQD